MNLSPEFERWARQEVSVYDLIRVYTDEYFKAYREISRAIKKADDDIRL